MKRRTFMKGSVAAAAVGVASGWTGCRPAPPSIEGTIVGPNRELGHRLRDGGLPTPERFEQVDVVVVGGGVAGLAVARTLSRAGGLKLVQVELESEVGGNSGWGQTATTAYPWGAHYVPLPGREAVEVLRLFEELGVITGHDSAGRPFYREEFLCHDP